MSISILHPLTKKLILSYFIWWVKKLKMVELNKKSGDHKNQCDSFWNYDYPSRGKDKSSPISEVFQSGPEWWIDQHTWNYVSSMTKDNQKISG